MNTKTIIIIVTLLAICMIILMPKIIKDNNEYSAHVCEVEGLNSNCQ